MIGAEISRILKRIPVYISGQGTTLWLPAVPRKGEVLDLGSLTRGQIHGRFLVSRVEWKMEQTSGEIHVWLTVRRINHE